MKKSYKNNQINKPLSALLTVTESSQGRIFGLQIRCKFHQSFTRNFYAFRSQKRKNDSQVICHFVLLGSTQVKAGHSKYVVEIDPSSPLLSHSNGCLLLRRSHWGLSGGLNVRGHADPREVRPRDDFWNFVGHLHKHSRIRTSPSRSCSSQKHETGSTQIILQL